MGFLTAFIATSLLLLYTVLLFVMLYNWKKATVAKAKSDANLNTKVAIVIPFRNEEQNINRLIHCLREQTYSTELVRFILVDDHSNDKSHIVANSLIEGKSEFTLLKLEKEYGKKAALQKGITESQSELIITIDADVIIEKQWLEQIVCYYERNQCDMMILPVSIDPVQGLFQKLQQLDFLHLAGLTGASAQMKLPLMCNGANLCFKRKAFEAVSATIKHRDVASGDDMFLLLEMKKHNKRIDYFFSSEVVAKTRPSESLNSFLSQRIRWASKARLLKDWHIIFSGLLITLTNMFMLPVAIHSMMNKIEWSYFLGLISIKILIDFVYLKSIAISFGRNASLIHSIVLTIVYPIYVVILPILILFFPAKWKGRTLSLPTQNNL